MKNYQTLIGFALVAIAIIIAAVIISGALNDFASSNCEWVIVSCR